MPERASRFPGEDAVYRQYLERLTGFARREGIPYLDVVDARQWSDGLFNDYRHMTVASARLFTTLLVDAWLAASP